MGISYAPLNSGPTDHWRSQPAHSSQPSLPKRNEDITGNAALAKETADAFYSSDRQVTVYDDQRQVVAVSRVPTNFANAEFWRSMATLPQLARLIDSVDSNLSYATVAGQVTAFAPL